MTKFVGMVFLAFAMACSSSTGPGNLTFEGRSTVSLTPPMDVQAVITVRNIGDKAAQINPYTCGFPLKAYTTPLRNGTAVWQSYDPALTACMMMLPVATLAPGDHYDFNYAGTIPSSLPSGVYYLAATVNGRLVAAGQFEK
jgi:hypothetical protein